MDRTRLQLLQTVISVLSSCGSLYVIYRLHSSCNLNLAEVGAVKVLGAGELARLVAERSE